MDPFFSNLIIDSRRYSYIVNKLREFCMAKGFVEVHAQNRLSIMAACEDPETISTFTYAGHEFPLPQTSQMWLEWEILTNPGVPGYFCVSTSYRNERNPIADRHDLIFPMFEFELHGDMAALEAFIRELVAYIGYGGYISEGNYKTMCAILDARDIGHREEQIIYKTGSPVFLLKNFPESTSPFWNMRRNTGDDTAKKIDVIMSGLETIGSAEREVDPVAMRERFSKISDGKYAELLYDRFGRERVDAELDRFLALDFRVRCGGGIGITRLIKFCEKEGLFPDEYV
jgi:aspartyl/asparaginyl-tRNA synthetase